MIAVTTANVFVGIVARVLRDSLPVGPFEELRVAASQRMQKVGLVAGQK